MKQQLFKAKAKNKVIHFDIDGRLYEFNAQTNSYLATERFVYLDYFDIALFMLTPEHLTVGWREPIENDVTYEICDE